MLSLSTEVNELLSIAPEWEPVLKSAADEGQTRLFELLGRLGARAIYLKAISLTELRGRFLALIRDGYYHPLFEKMLQSNQNLRRFWAQRRVSAAEQRQHVLSLASDLSLKLEGVLARQLDRSAEDGYRVLLPAYLQRAVQNAAVDYIRQEWAWERQTLHDLNLDPNQEDPRQNVAEDLRHAPENLALSNEQVSQLNQLRSQLEQMINDPSYPREALVVIDCLFGLGLSEHSRTGSEMTMRECCDRLKIAGETPARRIARCQVLMDKGLDLIRQRLREKLPGLTECWQGELNVNVASRRELSQQIGMTEGEIDRLIKHRQYHSLDELVGRDVVKKARLPELASKGAVAAFVPVDINKATVRDLMDILGLSREAAQRAAAERPFERLAELADRGLLKPDELEQIIRRGAVARRKAADARRLDLNRAERSDLTAHGVPEAAAALLIRGRPFLTWAELEDYLGCEPATWAILRQKFCLGL